MPIRRSARARFRTWGRAALIAMGVTVLAGCSWSASEPVPEPTAEPGLTVAADSTALEAFALGDAAGGGWILNLGTSLQRVSSDGTVAWSLAENDLVSAQGAATGLLSSIRILAADATAVIVGGGDTVSSYRFDGPVPAWTAAVDFRLSCGDVESDSDWVYLGCNDTDSLAVNRGTGELVDVAAWSYDHRVNVRLETDSEGAASLVRYRVGQGNAEEWRVPVEGARVDHATGAPRTTVEGDLLLVEHAEPDTLLNKGHAQHRVTALDPATGEPLREVTGYPDGYWGFQNVTIQPSGLWLFGGAGVAKYSVP